MFFFSMALLTELGLSSSPPIYKHIAPTALAASRCAALAGDGKQTWLVGFYPITQSSSESSTAPIVFSMQRADCFLHYDNVSQTRRSPVDLAR